jgi:hypothetical protein
MKKATKKIIHVIISLVYIVWGIGAPLSFVKNLADLNFDSILSISTILTVATGIVMLLAGILGLLRLRPIYRRLLGILIFVLAASSAVSSLMGGHLAWQAILQAVMAWLYIIW